MKKVAASIVVLVVLLGCAIAGGQWYLNQRAEKELAKGLEKADILGDVQCDKVSVNLFTGAAHFHGLKFITAKSPEPIFMDEVVVHTFRWGASDPGKQHFELIGMKSEAGGAEYIARARAAGLDPEALSWNLECAYDYARDKKTLDINTLRITEDQMGTLEMDFHFSNLNLPEEKVSRLQAYMTALKVLSEAKVVGASLTYKDPKLLVLAMEQTAKERGMTIAEVKAEMIETLDAQMTGNESPAVKAITDELKKFVNDPESLTIRLSPPEPFGMLEMQAVTTVDDKLRIAGVEVNA